MTDDAPGAEALRATLDALAKAARLPAEATARAFAALAPAFALGLGRLAAPSGDLPPLVEALVSGPARRIAASVQEAGARAQGEAALKAMFGDAAALELLATQASAASGLDRGAVLKLLPAFAAVVADGVGRGLIAEARTAVVSALRAHPLAPPEPQPDRPPDLLSAGLQSFAGFLAAFGGAPKPRQSPVDAGFEALSRVFETGRALQDAQAGLVRDALRALGAREPS